MSLAIEHTRVVLAVCLAMSLGAGRVAAQSNSALDFDGVDDYVEIDDPLNASGPFTLEAWIYARSGASGGRVISNRNGTGGYELDVNDDGLAINVRFVVEGSVAASASFQPYMSQWTHVAVTWEGPTGAVTEDGSTGAITLYINGAPAGNGTRTAAIPESTLNLVFGKFQPVSYGRFDGRIDEVRIWNAVLDGTTISEWMNSHVTGSHPAFNDLRASWRFDEGDGQVIESDVGGSAMNGRLGSDMGDDVEDPIWVASDVVPVEETSVGRIKARFRPE